MTKKMSAEELIDKRKRELTQKGYSPGIIDLSIEWARNSAQGMANYFVGVPGSTKTSEELMSDLLPRYLKDTENWIKSFRGSD